MVKSLRIDWVLLVSLLPILGAGLVTMSSFGADTSRFLGHQLVWIGISLTLFFALSFVDFRFLRRTTILVVLFLVSCFLLVLLFALGHVAKGAKSWFSFGGFSFQPSDPIKIVLILILAKYFSRRHVEIAHIKHIIISGMYAFIIFGLVLIQPDFGSAITIFLIWFGMVLVSGISRKHLLLVFLIGAISFGGLWQFGFKEYQKNRIKNFYKPLL